MKKIIVLIVCILGSWLSLSAQTHRIIQNSEQQFTFQVTVGELQVSPVNTDMGDFDQLQMAGCATTTQNVGKPQLPMIAKMIEIPLCGDLHVTATAARTRTLSATEAGIYHTILPTQPQYHKSYTGDKIFAKDETTYQQNAPYGMPLATVSKVGISRNVNMAAVNIYPVQVNPVTNEVTVFEDITITVTYDDVDMVATREMKIKYGSRAFGRPAEIINPLEFVGVRDAITTTPIKYVIIANSMFRGQFDQFIAWKQRKGFLVEIAYTDVIGTTTTAIKNYISGLFTNATPTNPAPTYVLLVGDNAQLPAYDGQYLDTHVTDLYYFLQVGNDMVPDCYWGRFSAQNIAQLTPQIQKTLTYEQYAMPDPTYLDRTVLVAGEDNGRTGDFGYSHANPVMHYFEDTYAPQFFTTINSYYNPHTSSNVSSIQTELSNGTGYANYTAHCSADGWYFPSFTTTHASSMTNTGKYGLMIGNCCQSNKFEESTCFGEALLRAENTGAVGYIGGTDYTYWDHDFFWAAGVRNVQSNCSNCNSISYDANNLGAYDRLCHTHNEPYSDWFVTQGSMIYAGNMAVQEACGASNDYTKYYWEIYQLMGDPSVMPWMGQASDMTMRIEGTAVANQEYETYDGATTLSVSTGAPYSYIALTHNLDLITATVSDAAGNATLTFPELITGEIYELAASAQNYKTTFTTIRAIPNEGANVRITHVAITNNQFPTANSNITLDVNIQNSYPETATQAILTATTTSHQITLSDATENIGTVNSGTSRTLHAAIGLHINSQITDGDIVPIQFTVTFLDNGITKTTQYAYDLTLVSAHLSYVSDSYVISGGNNDPIIDEGETVTLTITNVNDGHAPANDIVSELSTYYALTPVANGSISIGTLNDAATCTSNFTINIGTDIPNGTIVPFYHHIYSASNPTLSRTDTIQLVIGSVSSTETWESGNMSQFDWTCSGDYPWEITSSGAYAGRYCVRSTNYHVQSSASELELTIHVPVDGEISYYSKVSSENNYDYFRFYLDGEEKEHRSGNSNSTWEQSTWAVSAGTHHLKFSYEKDFSQNVGSDRAWVDNITLPIGGTIAPMPEGLTDVSHLVQIVAGNGDEEVNPNETISITVTTENAGIEGFTNVQSTLATSSPYATITNANQIIPSIAAHGTATTTYQVQIADNTPNNTQILFTHTTTDGSVSSLPYSISVPVTIAPFVDLVDISENHQVIAGNSNSDINPGETWRFQIISYNNGLATAHNAVSELFTTSTYATIGNATQSIGNIDGEVTVTTQFDVTFDSLTPASIINFTHRLRSDEDTCTLDFNVSIVEFNGIVVLVDDAPTISITSGNDDAEINPGETIKINIYTHNTGNMPATNVVSTLTTENTYATILTNPITLGSIQPNGSVLSQFQVAIADNTPDNTQIIFTHEATNGTDNCESSFDITIVDRTTHIADYASSSFHLFPNPANDHITVELSNTTATHVNLYNAMGQLVSTISVAANLTHINLSNLAKGFYFVKIYDQHELIGTAKITKL